MLEGVLLSKNIPPNTGRSISGLADNWKKVRLSVLLLAVFIGVANAINLIGLDAINPTQITWLKGDPATHYLGWAFFRQEEGWHFPLTWVTRLGYPVGVSISFLDSIPGIAVALKPFSGLLPKQFQYLGLYICIIFSLQFYFGFRLFYRASKEDVFVSCAGGILLVFAPAITWRILGHYALASHWLILAAFSYYFDDLRSRAALRWLLPFLLLVAVAGSINPYISLLTLLVAFAAVGRLVLQKFCTVREGVVLAVLPVAILAVSLVIFGFLVSTNGSGYAGGGYGGYSLNLLSPFNPMQFGSILLPALPVADPMQYEGYNYLGLGVLALLVLGFIARPSLVMKAARPDILPLVGVGLVCTLLAASTKITLGPLILTDFDPPGIFGFAARAFRASGRLFWPAHYLLIIAAIMLVHHSWRRWWKKGLLVTAIVLQFFDMSALRSQIWFGVNSETNAVLISPIWRSLGQKHDHLVVLPAWQCGPDKTPGGGAGFDIFGKLAAEQGLTINSYYAGRFGQTELKVHCGDIATKALAGLLDPKTAYVFSPEFLAQLAGVHIHTHRCSRVDGFNLCVYDPSDEGSDASKLVELDAPVLAMGQTLDFRRNGNASKYTTYGWSINESWGTWTEGSAARISARMYPKPEQDIELIAHALAFVSEAHPEQVTEVLVNEQVMGRWTFSAGEKNGERRVVIPADVIASDSAIRLEFRLMNPISPQALGVSEDMRNLGIGIIDLRFVER